MALQPEPGDVCEFITYGRQLRKGNNLYLVVRFWDGRGALTLTSDPGRGTRATITLAAIDRPHLS